MKTGAKAFASLLALLLLVSCATSAQIVTNVALVNPGERLPPQKVVAAFTQPPTRAYREIAQLETMAAEEVLSSVSLVEHMRAKAAQIGADAIVVDQKNETRKTVSTPLGAAEITSYRVLKGIAIKFE
ncbi:MAG: hypothetical protein HQL82_11050 [Magnetococcales bacterium]|nr:hypothetical protein [Magnetococcales bacterium]